jgi:hypothetical protein
VSRAGGESTRSELPRRCERRKRFKVCAAGAMVAASLNRLLELMRRLELAKSYSIHLPFIQPPNLRGLLLCNA